MLTRVHQSAAPVQHVYVPPSAEQIAEARRRLHLRQVAARVRRHRYALMIVSDQRTAEGKRLSRRHNHALHLAGAR